MIGRVWICSLYEFKILKNFWFLMFSADFFFLNSLTKFFRPQNTDFISHGLIITTVYSDSIIFSFSFSFSLKVLAICHANYLHPLVIGICLDTVVVDGICLLKAEKIVGWWLHQRLFGPYSLFVCFALLLRVLDFDRRLFWDWDEYTSDLTTIVYRFYDFRCICWYCCYTLPHVRLIVLPYKIVLIAMWIQCRMR